jgi:DNA repair ATPase RecN
MKEMSQYAILHITHLPQIAAKGMRILKYLNLQLMMIHNQN